MATSDYSKVLDAVQARFTPELGPLGFRKKGRAYNRTCPDGVVHAVVFQMGEFPVGRHYVIPGFRESYYGRFTINLGVFLPCVFQAEQQLPAPAFVREYCCTIRTRLSALAFGDDRWFELTADAEPLAATLPGLFRRHALPFMDQFGSYAATLAYFDANGDLPSQKPSRAALEAGIVAHHLGDSGRAADLLASANATGHAGFSQHVRCIAERLGYRLRDR